MTLHRFVSRLLDYAGPFIPARWRLPIRYYGWALSADAEPEAAQLFTLCQQYRCAVDVGANHGYYTYKMAKRFTCVCAFEANPNSDYDLQHYQRPNIRYNRYGLSDANRVAHLNIPIKKGVPYIGWASLANRDLDFADAYDSIPVELQRLDDQPFVREMPVDLIKIDVEGHELEVLLGGMETIRRYKPVLILEDNAEQRDTIRNLLGREGYQGLHFSELTGLPRQSPNIIYIPE